MFKTVSECYVITFICNHLSCISIHILIFFLNNKLLKVHPIFIKGASIIIEIRFHFKIYKL